MKEVVLTGLDGANPLAFLATLGVLEILTDCGMPARLAWRDDGVWHPVVTGIEGGIQALMESIYEDRRTWTDEPALTLEYEDKRDLKAPPQHFREYLERLVARAAPGRRRGVDWAAAFATGIAVDNNGNTKPTALHFTAGNQQFLKMIAELAIGVTAADVEEALVGPWRYNRSLPVMGWDATASRAYALRASNPSGDKKLGVPGADWLAARGLACLPVVPVKTRVHTTGCVGGWKKGSFRWALWTVPLDLEVVRSTMRLELVEMGAVERAARGIGVVLACGIRRSDQGGYGSFDPPSVV